MTILRPLGTGTDDDIKSVTQRILAEQFGRLRSATGTLNIPRIGIGKRPYKWASGVESVLWVPKSLGREVGKLETESGRHAVGHKKGLGVIRPDEKYS